MTETFQLVTKRLFENFKEMTANLPNYQNYNSQQQII